MKTNSNDPLPDVLNRRSADKLLSVYMTAGFPHLGDTVADIRALAEAGIDFVEIGMPFSDPLADGPVIQQASSQALENGMSLALLFDQLAAFRGQIPIPAILMGYINPVLRFGVELFCQKAKAAGVSGVILPDLPMREYLLGYREFFQSQGLHFIFLVTPTTPESRIRQIDEMSTAFIYAVGSSSTTGSRENDLNREAYLQRLRAMNLKSPLVVGFGIKDRESLQQAWKYAKGGIVGTAYIQRRMAGQTSGAAVLSLLRHLGQTADNETSNAASRQSDEGHLHNPLNSKLFIP